MLFRPKKQKTVVERARSLLWPRRGLHRGWRYHWHRVARIAASPHVIALGFAAGVFASFTPYIGLHFAIAAAIAFACGGSILASAVGTAVGNPLTFPFIWLVTYDLGGFLLGYGGRAKVDLTLPEGALRLILSDPSAFWREVWQVLEPVILPMSVGCVPVGIASAALSYFIVRSAVAGYQRRRGLKAAARVRQ